MLLVLVFSVYIGYRILTYDYMSIEEIENAKLYCRYVNEVHLTSDLEFVCT